MISQRKKIVLVCVAIIFGLAAGFLIAEIILRIAPPEWLSKEIHELNLARNAQAFGSDAGWSVERTDGKFVRFVPGSQFPVRYYEYKHLVHIDEWGGRAVALKKGTVPLIPFLGDSFPFGIGVRDEETFVSLLNSESRYQYLNLSVPGSALPNQLDQIEFRHTELHSPAVYVFSFFCGNDFMDIFRYHGKLQFADESKNSSRKIPESFINWLDRHVYHNRFLGKSYLLQLTKQTILHQSFYGDKATKNILPRTCLHLKKGSRPVTSSVLLLMAAKKECIDEMDLYVRQTVDHLDQLSREMKFHPIVIVIPDKIQVNKKLLEAKARAMGMSFTQLDVECANRLIEKELRAKGIPFFDVSECLREKGDAYYEIDGHFTPKGHRLVAQYLSHKLDATIADLSTHR